MHTQEVRTGVKRIIVMNPMSRKTSTLSLRLVPSPTALSTVWMSWEVDGVKANVHSEMHGKGAGIHTRNLWKEGRGCHSVLSTSGLGPWPGWGSVQSSLAQSFPCNLVLLHEHQGQSLSSLVSQPGAEASDPSLGLPLALHKSCSGVPACAWAGGNSNLCDKRPLQWA